MSWSEDALALRIPHLVDLPRSGDRVSFIYLDRARVWQDETGVVAVNDRGEQLRLPVAAITTLLLGPGTSITSPATIAIHRAGCSILTTSDGGLTSITAGRHLSGRAKWSEAQARLWTDPAARLTAARTLYERRFPTLDWSDQPMRKMRGLEGRQVKVLYRQHAGRAKLVRWRRNTRGDDAANQMLNLANSILYGSASAAVHALGLNPALGFIHQGAAGALLFDLADNHKAESSIPIAFGYLDTSDPAREVRRAMRDYLHTRKVLDDHLRVLDDLLGPHVRPTSDDDLLLDDHGHVEGHTNHARSDDVADREVE